MIEINEQAETITLTQLQALLAEAKGAKIVTIITMTEPDLKKNNLGIVWKISKVNGIVNWNYGESVNKQREREGKKKDFIVSPRKWGTRLAGMPFVSHVRTDGEHKLYLEMKVESSKHDYRRMLHDSLVEVPKEEIEPFLKGKKKDANQGLDKEVICRDYDIDNILSIAINGNLYKIEG